MYDDDEESALRHLEFHINYGCVFRLSFPRPWISSYVAAVQACFFLGGEVTLATQTQTVRVRENEITKFYNC